MSVPEFGAGPDVTWDKEEEIGTRKHIQCVQKLKKTDLLLREMQTIMTSTYFFVNLNDNMITSYY